MALPQIITYSQIIIALGIIFFYFGILINSAIIWQWEKETRYITGMLFFLVFVLLAGYLGYWVSTKIIINNLWWILLIEFIILFVVRKTYTVLEKIIRPGCEKIVYETFRKRITNLTKNETITKLLVSSYAQKPFKLYYDVSFFLNISIFQKFFGNQMVIFFISIINMWMFFLTLGKELSLLVLLIMIFWFYIVSQLSIIYRYSLRSYFISTLYLKNGDKIIGNIIKMGDYIHIVTGRINLKTVYVNKDDVLKIENDFMTKKKKVINNE